MTIIERLGERRQLGEVVTMLAEEFEAPRATISADVRCMLQVWPTRAFLPSRPEMADFLPGRRDPWTEPPMGLLLELTHRCPCNVPTAPIRSARAGDAELRRPSGSACSTRRRRWACCRVHISGGEPTARTDLEIVAHARGLGLYSNLITAGVLLDERRIARLRESASSMSS